MQAEERPKPFLRTKSQKNKRGFDGENCGCRHRNKQRCAAQRSDIYGMPLAQKDHQRITKGSQKDRCSELSCQAIQFPADPCDVMREAPLCATHSLHGGCFATRALLRRRNAPRSMHAARTQAASACCMRARMHRCPRHANICARSEEACRMVHGPRSMGQRACIVAFPSDRPCTRNLPHQGPPFKDDLDPSHGHGHCA